MAVPGLTGASGNIYVGLHEFEDMAFVLHALRPDDLFADVGANIGSFTVLASAVVGARTVCFEPAEKTYGWLLKNIAINQIESLVIAHREVVGAASGRVDFTQNLDCVNHVASTKSPRRDCSPHDTADVAMVTLDAALKGDCPRVIKIDVEGFETAVVRGAGSILRRPELLAVVMELNGSGIRYGYEEPELRAQMHSLRFHEYSYAPFERALHPLNIELDQLAGNIIFVRDVQKISERLKTAPTVNVRGIKV